MCAPIPVSHPVTAAWGGLLQAEETPLCTQLTLRCCIPLPRVSCLSEDIAASNMIEAPSVPESYLFPTSRS